MSVQIFQESKIAIGRNNSRQGQTNSRERAWMCSITLRCRQGVHEDLNTVLARHTDLVDFALIAQTEIARPVKTYLRHLQQAFVPHASSICGLEASTRSWSIRGMASV